MKNQKNRVELLAPAGNMEGFLGAIHAGADAVYLSGKQFGARAYADNFSQEELLYCLKYAHLRGRKVYLTVNTLTRNQEIEQLFDFLLPLYEAGLDGVIIQDMGVFQYIAAHFPDMEKHISTQMTITEAGAANFLKKHGAVRIVPARELSLAEIKQMKEQTGLEIECFIHGAMCYCYSGQCLFSSMLGGRSGNRGRCAQPCRLPYRVAGAASGSEEHYPLSLRDMCTIEHIPQLIEAGIDSFKIEGRMKKPEYTAGVTAIYRHYIDQYYANCHKSGYEYRVKEQDIQKLKGLYMRSQLQNGYYFKHNGRDMVTLDNPSYSGTDEALVREIRKQFIETPNKLPVSLSAYFYVGQPGILHMTYRDITVTVEGGITQPASKQPMSEADIRKQLSKLGNTDFILQDAQVYVEDNAFFSIKELNELRRAAVSALEQQMLLSNGVSGTGRRVISKKEQLINRPNTSDPASVAPTKGLHVSCNTLEQLQTVADLLRKNLISIERLSLESDLLVYSYQELRPLLQELSSYGEIYIALPYIIRLRDEAFLERLSFILQELSVTGLLIRSLSGLSWLQQLHFSGKVLADSCFYLWNRESIHFWKTMLTEGTLPLEFNSAAQQELLQAGMPLEKIIYGRIPMMITAGCVANTTDHCQQPKTNTTPSHTGMTSLTDRYQKSFPVQLCCSHCYNIIYNSLPLSLHKELGKWWERAALRISLTTENATQTGEVILYFSKALQQLAEKGCIAESTPVWEYTTGHEKKGAE